MNIQLQKAIEISGQTGERVIVVDTANKSSYVIMSLDEYERLTIKKKRSHSLTEEKLLDKINRDIALWKNSIQDENFSSRKKEIQTPWNTQDEEIEEVDNYFNKPKQITKKNWEIPKNRKKEALEIIEEEKQYLEELPY